MTPRSVEAAREVESEETVRAFFAIELCPEARDAADDVAAGLRARAGGDGVKWVRPENFHVTLRFLGDVPRSRVAVVAECAADSIATAPEGHEPFEMRLGEIGAFPTLRRPRVLTLDVTPHQPLEALANSLARAARQAGLVSARGEGEPAFHSHLTLGRVRRGGRSPSLASVRPTDPVPTRVEQIVLFRSELAQSGAIYTQMERVSLGKRN